MFKNPFSFNGRIRRSEYGFSVAIFLLLFFLFAYLTESMIRVGADIPLFAYTIFSIPLLWFYFAQGAKRAHDIGISGWLGAIHFFLIFFLILLERPIYYGNNIYDTLIGITFILNFIFFVIIEGEKGPNKYGDDPKGVGNTSQSGGGFTPPNNPQYPTGGYQNGNNFGGHNGGYNNQQQGTRFYNGGYNAPQTPPQQGGGFYNGGHNANPQQWQQQGQQPQGGGFYNGGHNANNQPNNSPQRQPQQTPPQPKRGDGKDFDGNLYGKAN